MMYIVQYDLFFKITFNAFTDINMKCTLKMSFQNIEKKVKAYVYYNPFLWEKKNENLLSYKKVVLLKKCKNDFESSYEEFVWFRWWRIND